MSSKHTSSQGASLSRREALRLMASGAGSLPVTLQSGSVNASPATTAEVASQDWDYLQRRLTGTLVPRGHETYQTTRQAMIWNARKISRQPEAIVRVANEADVRETVLYARSRGLKVAVRGGGHNWSAPSLRDGGILLDLSGLNKLEVNVDRRMAAVQPGAKSGELAAKLSPLGLAFPVGHCPTVPLSGYLLGGGIGWNSGAWGPACMSVKGIELVTAKGESIYADAQQNPDYFWAARGAGPGFFGILTRYHLGLYPLPKAIRTSTAIYALKDLERVATWLPELARSLRPEVELICMLVTPPNPLRATERVFVVNATAFADTEDEARTWLQPLEDGPATFAIHKELYVDTPMSALLATLDNAFPTGFRYAADVFWTNAAPIDFLARVGDAKIAAPSPRSILLIAIPPVPPPDAPKPDVALSMIGGAYVGAFGIWENADDDEKNIAWAREITARMEPVTIGYYVGESDLTVSANRARRCFAPANWEKLQRLKKKYDPEEVFYSFLLAA